MGTHKSIEYNLKCTKRLILKAVKHKTDFILTPEISSLFSMNKKQQQVRKKHKKTKSRLKALRVLSLSKKKKITKKVKPVEEVVEAPVKEKETKFYR